MGRTPLLSAWSTESGDPSWHIILDTMVHGRKSTVVLGTMVDVSPVFNVSMFLGCDTYMHVHEHSNGVTKGTEGFQKQQMPLAEVKLSFRITSIAVVLALRP